MDIITAPATRVVDEYDFVFTGGVGMSVTIDALAGDSISFDKATIKIFRTAKPTIGNPDMEYPAEDITLFVAHIVSVQHRTREIQNFTPDQQLEWLEAVNADTRIS
jgi:hypothetical protein